MYFSREDVRSTILLTDPHCLHTSRKEQRSARSTAVESTNYILILLSDDINPMDSTIQFFHLKFVEDVSSLNCVPKIPTDRPRI